jgi:hypothetical protein
MRMLIKRSIFATLSNVIAVVKLAGPMLLAAAGVGGLLFLAGAGPQWPWIVWVVVAPALYLCWLILLLAISAFHIRQMCRRYPKPRHFVIRPGQSLSSPEGLGFRWAMTSYRRMEMIDRLPFARDTGLIPFLETLWRRAYSPTLHFGSGVADLGLQSAILDPDLTEVGDNTVLGGGSVLCAHTGAVRPDGCGVYTSAPIKIGRRVTIGGKAYVSLGCVIEDDVVVLPFSVVAPFTTIPAGEVWGGNPATFVRKCSRAATTRAQKSVGSTRE